MCDRGTSGPQVYIYSAFEDNSQFSKMLVHISYPSTVCDMPGLYMSLFMLSIFRHFHFSLVVGV